jgi:hypothetical protein
MSARGRRALLRPHQRRCPRTGADDPPGGPLAEAAAMRNPAPTLRIEHQRLRAARDDLGAIQQKQPATSVELLGVGGLRAAARRVLTDHHVSLFGGEVLD